MRTHTMAPDRNQHLIALESSYLSPAAVGFGVISAPEEVVIVGKDGPGARPKRSPRKAALSEEAAASTADDEDHPSRGHKRQAHHPSKAELWEAIREEASEDARLEPALASFLYSNILANSTLEKCMSVFLGNKLSTSTVLGAVQIMGLFQEAYLDDPDIIDAAVADILAVNDRDPACEKYSQCLLYFKGWQAIQCHRVSHWLWCHGRKTLALAIQSRVSEILHVDIHPAAYIGKGVLLDHATGVVIGETAVVGDNVSMLHHVTLGGSGTSRDNVRHPTIGHGVLLGAGVSVLGPVVVGAGSKVGAGSVVVADIPAHSVAVGVPAKIVKRNLDKEPVKEMDQCSGFYSDYVI